MTILESIWNSIKNFLSNLTHAVHDYASIANNIVNALKTLEQSQVGQFIETTLETLIPASTGLVNAFKLELPNIFKILELVTDETSKTSEQIVADGVAALQALKVSNPKLYALKTAGLATFTSEFFTNNNGEQATFGQLLALGQSVHANA